MTTPTFTNAVIKPGRLLTNFAKEEAALKRLNKCTFPNCNCNLEDNGKHECRRK